MPRGPWAPTSILIRDHLLEVGEDYPNSIWEAVKGTVEEMSKSRKKPYMPPTYTSIRILLYALRRQGLVTSQE